MFQICKTGPPKLAEEVGKSRALRSALSENVSDISRLTIKQTIPPSTMSSPPPVPPPHKHSCLLCARRKIKCDKQDPKCSNCTKSHAECIYQAPPPPQRHRKRQADEELIARLNHYEELLRSHKIDFKPSNTVLTPKSVQEDHVEKASPSFQSRRVDAIPQSTGKSGDGRDRLSYPDWVDVESRSPWTSLSNEVSARFLRRSTFM